MRFFGEENEAFCMQLLTDLCNPGSYMITALRIATKKGYVRVLLAAHQMGVLTARYQEVLALNTELELARPERMYDHLLAQDHVHEKARTYLVILKRYVGACRISVP